MSEWKKAGISIEQLQQKARTAEEIWAMLDKLKRADKLLEHKIPYEEYETPKELWIKLADVKQLLEKIDEILNHEYPPNWSPCATAMTRISRLRELLKK